MKPTIFVTAPLTALAAVLIAPAAWADENQYLTQVANSHLSVVLTPSEAISLGNSACQTVRSAVANGMSLGTARAEADQAVGYAQQKMGLGLNEADGSHLVDAAVDQLC